MPKQLRLKPSRPRIGGRQARKGKPSGLGKKRHDIGKPRTTQQDDIITIPTSKMAGTAIIHQHIIAGAAIKAIATRPTIQRIRAITAAQAHTSKD